MISRKDSELELGKKNFSKKTILIVGALICVLVFASGLYISSTHSAKADNIIQGTLQMEETDLNSKIPGEIKEILVSEGQEVKKGDVIITLTSETIEAKLKQAESAKMAAEAQASKADSGARSQEVAQAKAAYDYAQKTYDRMKILLNEGAIAQATFDQVNAKYIAAKETYNMAVEGARKEDKEAAEALVLKADGAVAEVNSYLEDSRIKAPMDGQISVINVNPGELVSSGMPLASVVSKKDPWVEVNVGEDKLSMVNIGNEVTLKMPAYPNKSFKGKILTVQDKPEFATKRATNDNGDFDILSYGVKIKLIDVKEELYKGMTVIVDFETEE